MNKLTVTGRILFALPFGIFGLNHLFMVDFFTGMLTTIIPGGGFTVIFTGVLLITASILIILKKFVREAAATLAVLLLLFILTIHIPHLIQSATHEETMWALVNLLKDTSLMGGAILVLGICNKDAMEKEA